MTGYLLQLLGSVALCGVIGALARRGIRGMDHRRDERRSR